MLCTFRVRIDKLFYFRSLPKLDHVTILHRGTKFSITSAHTHALIKTVKKLWEWLTNYELGALADAPFTQGQLPLAQQATVGVRGQPHSREAWRLLMFAVQPLGRYPGGRGTGVS